MTFLNASLLAGAALIALPIVLHLIMRQKPKRFEFPALRFIQKRHDVNRRKLRLRHLLLLLLRAAAIALLAFALARPSLMLSGTWTSQEAPVAAAMVFDAAPHMEYRQDNQTRLESAQQMGLWLLSQLPQESQIAVLDSRRSRQVAFQVDRGAAKDRIHALATAADADALTAVAEQALKLLRDNELARKELYVFTDLSRGAWPADAAARLQDRLTEVPGVGVYVIDVGVERPSDFALGDVRLSAQVLSARSTLTIETDVLRIGPAQEGPAEKRSVELYLLDENSQPKKQSEQNCSLAPGGSEHVEFRKGSLGVGTHQGFVRIVGQDGLAADDTRYFTVAVRPPWRILLAAPKPAERYALFLSEALAPLEFRKRGEARFDCQVADLKELASRPLDDYAAVCLLDPSPLEPAVWQKLGEFAASGRGVGVFLGRNARPFDAFNQPESQELLPGKLLRQAWRPEADCYLAPRDYEHPILSAFRSRAGAIPWDSCPVFCYWELDKPAAGNGASVVLYFNDDRPAIFERPVGSGRVLTMTTPVSDRPDRDAWNLLPVGDPFVILVNQVAAYLVGSSGQQLNYYAGQAAVLPLDAPSQRRNYLVTTPAGMSYPLPLDAEKPRLEVTSTDQAGNYRIRAGGSAEGVDLGFSVNMAPAQTELERLSDRELAEVFGPFRYRLARTRDQIERDVSMARVGRELFPLLIFAVAMALLAEHVVANRFYRE